MKKNEIEISSSFKKQTRSAIAAIALFIIVFIIIILFSVTLTAVCIYSGYSLINSYISLLTIALGIGVSSLGIIVLFFIFKFIFKPNNIDKSHLEEVFEKDEPHFFEVIHDIASKAGTPPPKKIYISHEVNASVFYDSSFWSMFFSIKKNLHVGLGLINGLHQDEFKAIISHEFGHFSQKTMKVGSYVYYVNEIIFNLLYDNESYQNTVNKWGNISGFLGIFTFISSIIIEGIKWVLGKMYEIVNKSYLGLSREMEFHADQVAAQITGNNPVTTSLLRTSLIDHSLNEVLAIYDKKFNDNIKSDNIFEEQFYVMNFLSEKENIKTQNYLPNITPHHLNKFNKSKLIIEDQWSSHPSTEERIEKLSTIHNTKSLNEKNRANDLFSDINSVQVKITGKLFSNIPYKEQVKTNSLSDFKSEYETEYLNNSFSTIYNNYYDNKAPIIFDFNNRSNDDIINSDNLFSDKKVNLIYSEIAIKEDIETINNIFNKVIKIKSFDYDGKKYKRKESKLLLTKLNIELSETTKKIKQNDILIFDYLMQIEKENSSSELQNLYKQFFDFDKEYDENVSLFNNISKKLDFINYPTPFEVIKSNFSSIRALEFKIKKNITALRKNELLINEFTDEINENFDLYLKQEWVYFFNEKYKDENLEILHTALHFYLHLLSREYFIHKKALLDYQEKFLTK